MFFNNFKQKYFGIMSFLNAKSELDLKNLKDIYSFKFPDVVVKRTKEELSINDNQMKFVQLDLLDYMAVVKRQSQVEMTNHYTDVLWHNFILDTENYLDFCINYIGFFVHHKPFLDKKTLSNKEQENLYLKYKYTINNLNSESNNNRNVYKNNISDNDLNLFSTYYVFENTKFYQSNVKTDYKEKTICSSCVSTSHHSDCSSSSSKTSCTSCSNGGGD